MARIQLRRDTSGNWTTNNPVLASGELGIETDTNQVKIGNGIGNWDVLPYLASEGGVTSVNGQQGDVVLDKSDVGLGAVNNTSDAEKPISTATQAALDGKIGAVVEDTEPTLGANLNLKGFTVTSDTIAQMLTNLSIEPTDDNTQSLGASAKKWKEVFVNDALVVEDKRDGIDVKLGVRDGQIILTNTDVEVTTFVDLGGTTPDPGHLENVSLDGTGRYSVGPSGILNNNGFVTREFINTPGQFFVINDIDGGNFGGGDRQCFGLVRETIVDGTDLDGVEGLFAGHNYGGWSLGGVWYYTGGYPYIWTTYTRQQQSPQGAGEGYTGTFSTQGSQKAWWNACTIAGVGKKLRVGIADGTNSDQTGANLSNRLVQQLYVAEEIINNPQALALLPANVQTYGAGWYACYASTGNYENMGSFPATREGYGTGWNRQAGQDKGYRFRWSTFGNTTLNQLPYLQGVPNINDQIAAASGLSYYLVYGPTANDINAADVVLAQGQTSGENPFYPNETVYLFSFNEPYTSWETAAADVFDVGHGAIGAVQSSPLFQDYAIATAEEIIEAGLSVTGIQKIRAEVCTYVLNATIGYYMVRELSETDRETVRGVFATVIQAASTGQLQNLHDLIGNISTDNNLYPQELLDALQAQTALYLKNFPVF